ncbi:MAG: FAD-dependent oxidoreductase, partial [Pseudomonadota bacterium]
MSTQTITVRGAGIFGLSVAWALRARGARVRVVDPNGPGAGASGGVLGALAPHVPERWNAKKAFQFDSLILAEALWAEIAEVSGLDPGYGRIGRLQPIPDAAALALAQQRALTAEHLWQGRYHWRVIQAADAPIASPTGFYVHDDLSARLQPRRAIAALVEALRRRGVPVVAEAAADGPEVWATGAAGLSDLSNAVGQPVGTAVKGQAALLAADLSGPQLFVDALHIVPHGNRQVAVGSTTERDAADPTRTDGTLDALIDR